MSDDDIKQRDAGGDAWNGQALPMTRGLRRSLGPLLLERATMQDVAAAAGVSPKTVSRVINLEPGVADTTVTRVHNAIAELGYRRNSLALNLRKGVSIASVGMVVENLGNSETGLVAQAVDEVARRNDKELLIASSGRDAGHERQLVTDLLRRGVEGLLIVGTATDYRYLEPDLRLGARVVFLYWGPSELEADVVALDNAACAKRAVEHLAAYGHRQIAYIGSASPLVSAIGRHRGYLEAIEAMDLATHHSLLKAEPTNSAAAAEAATRLLLARPDPPTAMLAEHAGICVGVMRALRDSPAPVSLVGLDDSDMAEVLDITVVKYDPSEVGRAAAELLFARLAGDSRPPQRISVPTRLVVRGSGEVVVPAD
jgi:LacI family transcriptional regulator